jgi:group I intron endonuclease
MYIYKITNHYNFKTYIGKTSKTIQERFNKHKYNAYKLNQKTYLYHAMRKYGIDNFTIEIVEIVSDFSSLNEKEKYWIKNLNPDYNMTIGGDGGDTSSSPNFRNSMLKYHSSLNSSDYATYGMLGKSHSDSAKNKISSKNSYPVSCEGKTFHSIKEAQEYYKRKGINISIRKRIDNPKYAEFYRLRPKRFYS